MSDDLWAAVREVGRKLEAMQRMGIVASVNGAEVTVSYPDLPDSEPMPYLTSSSGFTVDPTVGDQALVIMPSGDPLMAMALCGVSSTDMVKGNKVAPGRADLIEAELGKVKDDLAGIACSNGTISHLAPYTIVGDVDANKVKVD